MTLDEAQARIAAIEREIQRLNNDLDERKLSTRSAITQLNAQRDELADVVKLHRAGLGHLIRPAGAESAGRVGTPGK